MAQQKENLAVFSTSEAGIITDQDHPATQASALTIKYSWTAGWLGNRFPAGFPPAFNVRLLDPPGEEVTEGIWSIAQREHIARPSRVPT
jgi:hypothetical protein